MDVGRRIAGLAGEHFGRHVGGRARNGLGWKVLEPGKAHDAEIEQLERPVGLQHHVVRLDVAVDDAGAVQRGGRAGKPDRDGTPLLQATDGARVSRVSRSSPT
jgi:hypothetical protein